MVHIHLNAGKATSDGADGHAALWSHADGCDGADECVFCNSPRLNGSVDAYIGSDVCAPRAPGASTVSHNMDNTRGVRNDTKKGPSQNIDRSVSSQMPGPGPASGSLGR